ncbi:MAG: transglycosylase SLT domain-containing protein [Alphaproteobacteria bacterium]|nr:transglycosylase SLT domain-containing protein [Alphaproteobacteria bacterium]
MPRTLQLWIIIAGVLAIFMPGSAAGAATPLPIPENRHVCQRATQQAETKGALPQDLLTAISFAESGKWDAEKQAIIAWPWTVTSGGKGHFFPDKQSAIAFVRDLQQKGVRNIDVGCMQVNLHYHPKAFSSLDEAFDPKSNARYAARFLGELHQSNKSWSAAVQRYHSADPKRGGAYRERVLNFWQKKQRNSAEVYRQSIIIAYRQKRAERQREQNRGQIARPR